MNSIEGAEALFLHATEGIIVVNDSGEIVSCNPSGEKLFGYIDDELIGKHINILIPKRYNDHHSKYHSEYVKDPQPRKMGVGRDLYACRKDGTEFPVEISLSPFNQNGKKFIITFLVDITLRKQAEDKLRNYSEDLEKQVRNRTLILEEAIDELEKTKNQLHIALEKERELSELKTRFVSMASHEFRTPLATMLSSLSLVTRYGEQNDKEKQSKHVARIKNSINQLNDILNDLLSVSKLEEGKIPNTPERINLRLFMGDILTDLLPLAAHSNQVHFEYVGDELVLIDPRLLRHILFNLISNALKYTLGAQPVHQYVRVNNGQIIITIEDHGIGIPEEDKKHLFTRFFRGHNASHIPGTGLGLSIVARYVELMNGTITFESKENVGTKFTLTFPSELNSKI